MLKSAIKNIFYPALWILPLAVLISLLILNASIKVIVVFSLLPVLAFFYINAPDFAKIVLPMVMITFPITLQVLGKDAFSTGTLFIFTTLAWALTKQKLSATVSRDMLIFKLLLLIVFIALTGMLTKTPAAYWGPAVRHYVNLISSISLFVLITHAQRISGIAKNNREYIEKVISALLLITVVHVFLSLLIFSYPWIEKYFTIFLHRTQENLGTHMRDDLYTRATSVFTGGEEFGELLILLFPFALYKLFISRKMMHWVVISSLLLGIVISGTRSAFLLILFQIVLFIYILTTSKYKTKKIVVTVSFISICVLMLPIFFKYGPILMDRVQGTLDQISQKEDIITIANRSGVWPLAWNLTIKTISLFGHGPIQAITLGFPVKNFHCLYMTILFQFGIIGSIVVFTFFFALFKRLVIIDKVKIKKDPNYLLSVTCLLSLFCFLINEIKFEFNRSDSYQQFVWIFFAIFYLSGLLWRNSKNEKTHHRQPEPIRVS